MINVQVITLAIGELDYSIELIPFNGVLNRYSRVVIMSNYYYLALKINRDEVLSLSNGGVIEH
jgi:hypothetical protein